jgi:hypothetical protein
MEEDIILLNRIRTPDGTVLTSYNRHDYRTHKDANGEQYMVDGGTAYLRRSLNKIPATDLTVYRTDDHAENRKAFHWGSYGREGDQPLTYRPLADLDDEHIGAILETQTHIAAHTRQLFEAEVDYRTKWG